ncbi:MAG: MerR family transcriptional regulator [Chloroflexi bacterium HGW-Chloroflexi-5]|jgi:DNA-binding transcriptional MerR regulator|nr:MAG: MerR family transcriptional regulator [Chloroflexi bacterium HGW-Chloroflexi-5]
MVNQERLSIKQVSSLAGVSVRTLHFYDQIGLLIPQRTRENNYRFYTQESLLKLQQILFYREMAFSLDQIAAILNQPDFDLVEALEEHRDALKGKAKRLNTLLETIDNTISNLKGQKDMTQTQYFRGFSDEQQAEYEKEAAQKWDPEMVHESNRRYKNLSQAEKDALGAKGERITLALRDAMPKGVNAPEVQALVGEWQRHISFFSDCPDEMLLGLGTMYMDDPRFKAFYDRIDPKLAEFFAEAIKVYCAERGVTE